MFQDIVLLGGDGGKRESNRDVLAKILLFKKQTFIRRGGSLNVNRICRTYMTAYFWLPGYSDYLAVTEREAKMQARGGDQI